MEIFVQINQYLENCMTNRASNGCSNRKGTKRDFEEETEYIVSHLTDSAVIEKVKAASKYFDAIQGSLSVHIKKQAWFDSHLTGL